MPRRQLTMALYAEGPIDQRFLPAVVQRTVERILAPREIDLVPISPIWVDHAHYPHRQDGVLDAARMAAGFHLLLVHSNADDLTWAAAKQQRFDPGLRLIQASTEKLCRVVVPVIPLRMVEAWMIADGAAVRRALRTSMPDHELGLPPSSLVETVADPKEVLNQTIQIAYGRRRPHRRPSLADIQDELARALDLTYLDVLSSYHHLVQDLTDSLYVLGMLV